MQRLLVLIASTCCTITARSQGNCLSYTEDSGERIACELSYRAAEYRQGSKESQILFDKAIEIGPDYAWAYYEKSVPYFKRGLLSEGLAILNNAIELEPLNYLYYRAFWYFQHGSYEACIVDLERHYNELDGPTVYNPPGDMEMRLILAMSYAQLHQYTKGIEAMNDCINGYDDKDYLIGYYDYHVLGLLYYLNEDVDEAQSAFQKQIDFKENFADSYYYLGLLNKTRNDLDAANDYFEQSLNLMDGHNEGFSANLFSDYNISRNLVESELNGS